MAIKFWRIRINWKVWQILSSFLLANKVSIDSPNLTNLHCLLQKQVAIDKHAIVQASSGIN